MATPPIGVILPSHFSPVMHKTYRLPENTSDPARNSHPAASSAAPPRPAWTIRPTARRAKAQYIWYCVAVWKFASSRSVESPPGTLPSDSNRPRRPWAPKEPIVTARKPQIAPVRSQKLAPIASVLPCVGRVGCAHRSGADIGGHSPP